MQNPFDSFYESGIQPSSNEDWLDQYPELSENYLPDSILAGEPEEIFFRKELVRSFSRRAFWHDYRSRCFYHITLKKNKNIPVFSKITDQYNQNQEMIPTLQLSDFGRKVEWLIFQYRRLFKEAAFEKFIIMPDHIHVIVNVKERFEPGLGKIIHSFKTACTSRFRRWLTEKNLPPMETTSVFEENYTDKILYRSGQLKNWNNYILDNPRRLLIKRLHPDLFNSRLRVILNNREYAAYGNILLLENPAKAAVRLSRSFTQEQKENLHSNWKRIIYNRGVLISPFISAEEKEVMRDALTNGANVIIIRHIPFREKEKPTGSFFDLCAEGRILYLTPVSLNTKFEKLSRPLCMAMNKFAEYLAGLDSPARWWKIPNTP